MVITTFQGDDGSRKNDKFISSFIPPFEVILKELHVFHKQLQIALEDGVRQGLDYFDEKKLPIDIYLLNQLIRYHTKRLMEEKASINLYEMDDLANNGLAGAYGGYHIRVFKGNKGNLPIPNSWTKVAFFCQQLDLGLDIPLQAIKKPNVFFLWELDNKYSLIPLRLVCPQFAEIGHDVTATYYDEILTNPVIEVGPEQRMGEMTESGDLDIKLRDKEAEKQNGQDNKNDNRIIQNDLR